MSKLNSCYWLQTEHFSNKNNSNILSETPYQSSKSPTRPSRIELIPESKSLGNKHSPLNTTQYPDLFITDEEGIIMHTGQRNLLRLPEDKQFNHFSTVLLLTVGYFFWWYYSQLLKAAKRQTS